MNEMWRETKKLFHRFVRDRKRMSKGQRKIDVTQRKWTIFLSHFMLNK